LLEYLAVIDMNLPLKRSTSYTIVAFIALIEIGIIWWAADYNRPPGIEIMTIALMAGIIIACFILEQANKIGQGMTDERVALGNYKSALRTSQIFWTLTFSKYGGYDSNEESD
jgi:hypothetical protein